MKKNNIYTKTGDNKTTSLLGNVRVLKSDDRVEAYGDLDELTAYLGLIKTLGLSNERCLEITNIQKNISCISSHIACVSEKIEEKLEKVDNEQISVLENCIDSIMDLLIPCNEFILPASNTLSAHINICRTICRRAERHIIAAINVSDGKEVILKYINRLSDYLFALFRYYDSKK